VEGRSWWNGTSEQVPTDLPGYWRRHASKGTIRNTRSPSGDRGVDQLQLARKGRADWDAERLAVPTKPGNSGGGKKPQLKGNARSNEGPRIGDEPNNSTKCSEVADGVARQSEGSPNFRFYVLYDKVYREDVMAFAYDCCKANRGAAGVDGQTFEDIEEYG